MNYDSNNRTTTDSLITSKSTCAVSLTFASTKMHTDRIKSGTPHPFLAIVMSHNKH